MKTVLIFIAAMLIGWLLLSLTGCTSGDIAIFSQTGTISTNTHQSTVKPLPRQMTTRDFLDRRRK